MEIQQNTANEKEKGSENSILGHKSHERKIGILEHKKPCKRLTCRAFEMVELTGFEPAASSSRTKRATRLRYSSLNWDAGF